VLPAAKIRKFKEWFNELSKRKSKKLQDAVEMAERIIRKETTYQSSIGSPQRRSRKQTSGRKPLSRRSCSKKSLRRRRASAPHGKNRSPTTAPTSDLLTTGPVTETLILIAI
jgi:hypothetical protein